jgi:hypothetical protein
MGTAPCWKSFSRGVRAVVLLLLVSGLLRLGPEARLVADLRGAGFLPPLRGQSAAEDVGVQMMMGALGGLRYMMATFLTLRAGYHWEFQDWPKVREQYRLAQLMEPRNPEVWSTGAWHCHSNAWAWYLQDDTRHSPETRRILAREWVDHGKEMLREGIRWNPDDPWLYRDLANVFLERDGDKCQAAEYYRQASEAPGAPEFLYRIHGYLLAQCGTDDVRAYEVLRGIYEKGEDVIRRQGVMIWKPSLIVELRNLEERLGIPPQRRIPERFDPASFVIATPWRPKESYPVYRRLREADLDRARAEGKEPEDPALAAILARLEAQGASTTEANGVPP